MKNTDLLCEIGLKYERNMGYQNMGGGQKYQSKCIKRFERKGSIPCETQNKIMKNVKGNLLRKFSFIFHSEKFQDK